MSRRWSWLAMALVLSVALAVGAGGERAPRTETERVRSIASEVRCPTCRGLSAEASDAKAAQAVREEVRARIRQGQSDDAIRAYLVSRYGKDILLKPEARGVAGLVWALPVAGGVLALAGLAAAFRRWRSEAPPVSAADRALVEEALGR
ncbi:MAG: cytochrome c-type biogenesis protein CcmH [Actinobacteria bacterium]|nr:cytochrome c-type biogenesis protein CcmH [Actinomycetota bacterium]MBW3651583.1 cytochrome c-type biogenesis protein CcmH [Actinomycetota bacterium]